jgi:hypothetical protein
MVLGILRWISEFAELFSENVIANRIYKNFTDDKNLTKLPTGI